MNKMSDVRNALVSNPQQGQDASGRWLSTARLTDPFWLAFAFLYGLAFLALLLVVPEEWPSALSLAVGVALTSAAVLFLSREWRPRALDIVRPQAELWSALIWCGGIFLLATLSYCVLVTSLVNYLTNALFMFLAPFGLLLLARGRGLAARETLRSLGLSRRDLGIALKAAIPTTVLFLPVLLLSINPQQRADILATFHAPLRTVVVFSTSFALASLLFFPEEFLFRGVLQSRLAAVSGSELRGIVVAALLFGLMHWPFMYFDPAWPTHDHLAWSLASVMTEHAVMGLLLGVLWARTHNLAAPILLHAFVNAFALMT